ncbi:putative DNA repair protein RAD51 [Cocos nucifera]|uniref:DNA repair protein RAD51 homolog 3 n=1 Tax=Cocos nucifera TaxID=13894 RepID=A0A8K0IJZ1_COCNU|nr:putative DNA repair protein RAD51 [Cocos nucifera]
MGCRTCEKPKVNYRKGLWSPEEDQKLRDYILKHGHSCWSAVPVKADWLSVDQVIEQGSGSFGGSASTPWNSNNSNADEVLRPGSSEVIGQSNGDFLSGYGDTSIYGELQAQFEPVGQLPGDAFFDLFTMGKFPGSLPSTSSSIDLSIGVKGVGDLNIALQEASDILKVMSEITRSESLHGGAQTAWDMLSEEQMQKHITTGCEDLDTILGGGIHCKEVTEVGGVPGIGKTQLGIQLAVNVQIPVEYGGLGGKAVYIGRCPIILLLVINLIMLFPSHNGQDKYYACMTDTEGSFMVERAYQIAEGCIMDTLDKFGHHQKVILDCQEQMQPNSFLANIFYFRICSYTEQIAVINYLEKFLAEQKDVKIIIIDSVTFHFRQDFDDFALRTRVLCGMSLKLMKLTKTYNLAVVLLNQVTTKFTEGSFQLTLALGKLSFFIYFEYDVITQKQYKRSAYLHAIAMQNHELKISAIFKLKYTS